MSTPSTRRGRRKLGLLAALTAALGLFLAFAGTASAAVTCTFNAATGELRIIVSGETGPNAPVNNTIHVTKGLADGILVNNVNCVDPATLTTATTHNTRQISVLSSAAAPAAGDDVLVIDERSGRYVPGAPGPAALSDGQGLNEIEWYVFLNGGFNQISYFDTNTEGAVTVGNSDSAYPLPLAGPPPPPNGTTYWDGIVPDVTGAQAVPADVALGDLMINLNAFPADDDADVFAPQRDGNSISVVNIITGGGDDFVSGKGGDGTGGPTTVDMVVSGGDGNDSCTGGLGDDVFLSCDFVDGNEPFEPFVFAFQDDVNAVWGVDFVEGDLIDFSSLPGPLTITLNPDGSASVSGVAGTFVGVEHVIGSQGNDTITGNNFENFLSGAGGDDTVSGSGASDAVAGDIVATVDNTTGVLSFGDASNPGNDTLAGDAGNDAVIGGPGNDTLNENTGVSGGVNGADALDGGPGVDTVDYGQRTTSVVVYLGLISTFNDGADLNQDGLTNEFDDVFFTTENAITGSGQDIISANFVNNRANNVFTDNDGNDCVEGGPGNDTFNQGANPQGADVLIGNTGGDTANYADRSGAVQVILDGVANDGNIDPPEGDNVGGFAASCRPATIVVNPPISVLFDFFDDGPGIINELTFLDAPTAGPAPSCFIGEFFLDGVIVNGVARAPQGIGVVDFCDVFAPGEQLGGDQAPLLQVDVENVNGGSGNDILVGDNTGNVLNGNAGDDQLSGNAGADQLNGGAGNDRIRGGTGNDAINGGEGTNTADYASAGAGGVGVNVNLTTGVATGEGNDTLSNIQNVNGSSFRDSINGNAENNVLNGAGGDDAISGNAGDDTINGGAGADQLSGQTGNDRIRGANGNDSMQGGAGNDNLQGGQGRDTILGQKGDDRLFGNAQPDFLNGGPGRDVCKPGSPGLARGDVVVNCER